MQKLVTFTVFVAAIFTLWSCGGSSASGPSNAKETLPPSISASLIEIDALPKLVLIRDMLAFSDNTLLITGFYDEADPAAAWGYYRNGIIYKIDSDGVLDTNFGSEGFLTFRYDDHTTSLSVATDSTGNIFLSGSVGDRSGGITPNQRAFVLKLTSDGTIEDTFGTSGIAYYDFTGYDTQGWGIAIQSNGKIVIGCKAMGGGVDQRHGLVRFDSNGDLDGAFATNGAYLSENLSNISPPVHNVVVQSDDSIITGIEYITSDSFSEITGFKESGSINSDFGINGLLDISEVAHYRRILKKQDGKVIVAGYNRQWTSASGPEIFLRAYSSLGQEVTSFGENGTALIDTDDFSSAGVNAIEEGPTGHIYFITDRDEFIDQYNDTYPQGIQLVRVNENGSIDNLFGDNGKWIYDTSTPEQGRTFAVLPNGTVFIGGMRGEDQIYEETLLLKVTIEE